MKKLKDITENLSQVSYGTWLRLALLLLAVVNMILRTLGIETFIIAEQDVADIISVLMLVITAACAYWKNNSFTDAAQQADRLLQEMRDNETIHQTEPDQNTDEREETQ